MEILNQTSFQFAPFAGRLNFPGHSLTLIVKGIFDLHPGETATPSEEQLYPTGDEFYPDDDEMTGSCRYESDFAYYKPNCDLLLAGHCHSPGGKPVNACRVTFKVGAQSAALNVFGDRRWKGIPGMRVISDPELFTGMELRYENSFGGPGYKQNPVGKGYRKEENETGTNSWPLPNIEDPNNLLGSPGSRPEPAGFGPLGKMWQQRYSKLGSYKGDWLKKRWPWFPLDFDWSYYNAAPPHIQVKGYLRGDEELFFENLHPEYSRYESRLPGLRVRCFLKKLKEADTDKTAFSEVPIKLDTLWVDMDAEKLALVWRGSAKVLSDEYEDVQHVFIMSEPLDRKPESLERYYELFLAGLAEAEAEEAIEPEEPREAEIPEEPAIAAPEIAVPGLAAAGLAAAKIAELEKEKLEEAPAVTEEAKKIDPETVKAQAKAILAQAGINMDSFPPEIQNIADQKMNQMIDKVTETDPEKMVEQQRSELEAQMNETFAKMGIDTKNLPPVTGKARQEQVRMMKELGLEDSDAVFQDQEMAGLWNSIATLLPKAGIDPENLTPLINEAKKRQNHINREIAKFGKQTETKAEPPAEEDRKSSDG